MQVHGTYYKRDKNCLNKKDFTLDVNDNPLPAMRREAVAKLQASDPDFAGLRELFSDKKLETLGTFGDSDNKPLIVIVDGIKYYLDVTDESNVYAVGKAVSPKVFNLQTAHSDKDFDKAVRQRAKELKIYNWHCKRIDSLIAEIKKHDDGNGEKNT